MFSPFETGVVFQKENFFGNPHLVRLWALTHKFYDRKHHPNKKLISYFPGLRTTQLNQSRFGKKVIDDMLELFQIHGKLIDSTVCFSLTDGSVKQQVHTDDEYGHINYTGIVYLNPSIPEDCGTIISSKQFPSKFNKLIFFDGKHPHTMAKSFGTNKLNSRLVMTVYLQFES